MLYAVEFPTNGSEYILSMPEKAISAGISRYLQDLNAFGNYRCSNIYQECVIL